MMTAHERTITRNFVQVLWEPREKDRVLVEIEPKYYRRGTVQGAYHGTYLTSVMPGKFLKSNQMLFIPRQHNYTAVLQRFVQAGAIQVFPDGYNYKMVRHFKKPDGTVALTICSGQHRRLLAALLESRIIDSELNALVNQIVMQKWGVKGIVN